MASEPEVVEVPEDDEATIEGEEEILEDDPLDARLCALMSDTIFKGFESHVQDTLVAGAGLCNEEVVRGIVEAGPGSIEELIELGMKFSERENGNGERELDLGREGGHSQRRILHAKDVTGREIERASPAPTGKTSATPLITRDKLTVATHGHLNLDRKVEEGPWQVSTQRLADVFPRWVALLTSMALCCSCELRTRLSDRQTRSDAAESLGRVQAFPGVLF